MTGCGLIFAAERGRACCCEIEVINSLFSLSFLFCINAAAGEGEIGEEEEDYTPT